MKHTIAKILLMCGIQGHVSHNDVKALCKMHYELPHGVVTSKYCSEIFKTFKLNGAAGSCIFNGVMGNDDEFDAIGKASCVCKHLRNPTEEFVR